MYNRAFKPLTIFTKNFIVDLYEGSKYSSGKSLNQPVLTKFTDQNISQNLSMVCQTTFALNISFVNISIYSS